MNTFKKILFYILSSTWGAIMTFAGIIVSLALLITGHKPKKFHHIIYFEVGENWGGFEVGPFFVCNKNPTLHIKQHEAGHSIQNIMFGPLMLFLVSIPSTIRYWLRNCTKKSQKQKLILIIFSIFVLIGVATLIVTLYSTLPWLSVIPVLFLIYSGIILIWGLFIEIPKYNVELGIWPDYDDIWFEGSATTLGKKYYSEE